MLLFCFVFEETCILKVSERSPFEGKHGICYPQNVFAFHDIPLRVPAQGDPHTDKALPAKINENQPFHKSIIGCRHQFHIQSSPTSIETTLENYLSNLWKYVPHPLSKLIRHRFA